MVLSSKYRYLGTRTKSHQPPSIYSDHQTFLLLLIYDFFFLDCSKGFHDGTLHPFWFTEAGKLLRDRASFLTYVRTYVRTYILPFLPLRLGWWTNVPMTWREFLFTSVVFDRVSGTLLLLRSPMLLNYYKSLQKGRSEKKWVDHFRA